MNCQPAPCHKPTRKKEIIVGNMMPKKNTPIGFKLLEWENLVNDNDIG